jgi:hypothetical protein
MVTMWGDPARSDGASLTLVLQHYRSLATSTIGVTGDCSRASAIKVEPALSSGPSVGGIRMVHSF